MEKPNIVGLISSDGDFKPYLDKLADKDLEFFVVTNNPKYNDFSVYYRMEYVFLLNSFFTFLVSDKRW